MATIAASATAVGAIGARRPSFLGLMRGEWLKLSRMWSFWIMVALMFGGFILYSIVLSQASGLLTDSVHPRPLLALAVLTQGQMFLVRVFWGMMIILLTARLIGMEYSSGTVRVILARGVGRLQLLLAQLSVMALVALVGAVVFIAFESALELIGVQVITGSLNVFNAASDAFWADTRNYALSVLVSLGVSILLAAAVTALTRSLAAGLTISVIWFPIDNFALILLVLGAALTHWDFWSLVSGDFLGLNLNAMGGQVMSQSTPSLIRSFLVPLVPVTGAHTLLVSALYAAAFIIVAFGLTLLRDVKE